MQHQLLKHQEAAQAAAQASGANAAQTPAAN
jgi:hypothetical protein